MFPIYTQITNLGKIGYIKPSTCRFDQLFMDLKFMNVTDPDKKNIRYGFEFFG